MTGNEHFLKTLVRLQGEVTTEDLFCVLAVTDEFCETFLRSAGFSGEVAESYMPYVGRQGTLRFSQNAEKALQFALPFENSVLFGLYLLLGTIKFAECGLMQILVDYDIKSEHIKDVIEVLCIPEVTGLSVKIKRPDSIFAKRPKGI